MVSSSYTLNPTFSRQRPCAIGKSCHSPPKTSGSSTGRAQRLRARPVVRHAHHPELSRRGIQESGGKSNHSGSPAEVGGGSRIATQPFKGEGVVGQVLEGDFMRLLRSFHSLAMTEFATDCESVEGGTQVILFYAPFLEGSVPRLV